MMIRDKVVTGVRDVQRQEKREKLKLKMARSKMII